MISPCPLRQRLQRAREEKTPWGVVRHFFFLYVGTAVVVFLAFFVWVIPHRIRQTAETSKIDAKIEANPIPSPEVTSPPTRLEPTLPPPIPNQRKLSDWQITRIKAHLAKYAGQRIAIVASSGRETHYYAMQFVELFKDLHWNVIGPLPAPADQDFSDLQLSIYNAPPGTYAIEPPALPELKSIFEDAQLKLRPTVILDENVPAEVLALSVGGKSPENIWSGRYPPLRIGRITLDMFPNRHK